MMWFLCFALTQTIEMPIYYSMLETSKSKKILWGFGASAITHPILWFFMPWHIAPFFYLLIAGETAVFILEGFYFKILGVKRPFYVAALANSVSLSIGILLDYFQLI